MPPRVLVTSTLVPAEPAPVGWRERPVRPRFAVEANVVHALQHAGAHVLLCPPDDREPQNLLAMADGVVLTGGGFDIHPSHYGQAVAGRLDPIDAARTRFELAAARHCFIEDVPLLGLCGGMQVMAVAAGGSLIQDLAQHPNAMDHEQRQDPAHASHWVRFDRPVLKGLPPVVYVNSTHHQAVADAGTLQPFGWALDGVVEAIHSPDHRFAVGVQWHPESMGMDQPFRQFVAALSPSDRHRM